MAKHTRPQLNIILLFINNYLVYETRCFASVLACHSESGMNVFPEDVLFHTIKAKSIIREVWTNAISIIFTLHLTGKTNPGKLVIRERKTTALSIFTMEIAW